jgi:hypothetical protein
MKQIPEKDWKTLIKLKDGLLQQFCSKSLAKLKPIVMEPGPDCHKAYKDLWNILESEDKKLSSLFDDLRKSTAFFKLASWKNHGLLSDKEFDQFSEETKKTVNIISN